MTSAALKDTQAEFPLLKKGQKTAGLTNRQFRHKLRNQAGKIMHDERVGACGRKRYGEVVAIERSNTGAHFSGVETCGSIWMCAVCAAKIAEKRREEVSEALEQTYVEGGAAYMITLTMRHAPFDDLEELKHAVAIAWRKVQGSRAWGKIKETFAISGTIRAMEITHGGAGWHPHLHILLLTEGHISKLDMEDLRLAVFEQWFKKIEALTGTFCHPDACDIRQAVASDYVTKWGSDREITKLNQKSSSAGRTPFQLLADSIEGDKQATKLFADYAKTFKGARHLTWSKGLKDRFGINDLQDEAIAQMNEERDQMTMPLNDGLKVGRIGAIDRGTWNAICKLQITGDVLDAAHKHGWRGVEEVLSRHGLKVYIGHCDYRENIDDDGVVTMEPNYRSKQTPMWALKFPAKV